jgi:hypothetical protein
METTKSVRLTMKEKVLRFVELHEAASFTMIQRFIVDTKFGAGTYDAARHPEHVYRNGTTVRELRNPYRGHFCTAFSGLSGRPGYFMVGADHLVKTESGMYRVVRGKK